MSGVFLFFWLTVAGAQGKCGEHGVTLFGIILEERKEIEPDKLQLRVEVTVNKERRVSTSRSG